MIDSIVTHVFDLLQADARLYRGGNAYSAGFSGVKRIDNGDVAAQDYVNLYDTRFTPDSDDRRPAVYAGTERVEATDEESFPAISSVAVSFRQIVLPLVIAARGSTRRQAVQKRNQLRANVMYILLDHRVENNYWYLLSMPGIRGGGEARQAMQSSVTGAGSQGVIEAECVLPLLIQYTMSAGGTIG